MPDSSALARSHRIEGVQSRAACREFLLLWVLTLGGACVNLTPPPELVTVNMSEPTELDA